MKLSDLSPEQRRRVSGMKCPKCKGYMVYDIFYDDTGESFWGWRCINCGKIVDQVILKNQPIGKQIDNLFDDYIKKFHTSESLAEEKQDDEQD